MQRLHSTAARRAMAMAGGVSRALSGLCRGPCPASPGGHHGLAHEPGEDRESEVRTTPQQAYEKGLLGKSLLLVAKGICPAGLRGASPCPTPPLTEATPSGQNLPPSRALGSYCSYPYPSRQNSLSGDRGKSSGRHQAGLRPYILGKGPSGSLLPILQPRPCPLAPQPSFLRAEHPGWGPGIPAGFAAPSSGSRAGI